MLFYGMKRIFIFLLGLLLILVQPATAQDRSIAELLTLSVSKAKHPLFVAKPNNIALQVTLDLAESDGALSLLEVHLNLSHKLKNINNIGVYTTGDSAEFFTENAFDQKKLAEKELVFSGNLRLKKGKNYLWISCDLVENANLDHRIGIDFEKIICSNGRSYFSKNTLPNTPFRIGKAVRTKGQEGVHTYRIPGLVTTNKGTLIAVYDLRRNGSVDLQEDIDVGMSRSTDGGQSWEPMKVIIDMEKWGGKSHAENGVGDPSVLVDRQTNTIWVAGIWAHGHPGKRNWWASRPGMEPERTSQLVLVKSEDDGLTWSDPINITSQIKHKDWYLLLQGPGKGITLKDGTLVFPAQFKDKDQMPHSTLIYSKDHGETWEIGTGAKSNTTESQVIELGDGSLMLNMRDNRGSNNPNGGARSVAITRDLGKTWVEHPTSAKALEEPVCMASLIRTTYQKKPLLLFSNPAVPKGPRRHISIKASMDEGMTWPKRYHTLLNADNSFGYSCLSMIDKRTVGILYEGRGEMYFQRIKLSEILSP